MATSTSVTVYALETSKRSVKVMVERDERGELAAVYFDDGSRVRLDVGDFKELGEVLRKEGISF